MQGVSTSRAVVEVPRYTERNLEWAGDLRQLCRDEVIAEHPADAPHSSRAIFESEACVSSELGAWTRVRAVDL